MIPILYEGNVQTFNNNGLGRLADAISCKVTEERNGSFELEMTYPITGIHYSDIQENRIIFAKTEDGGNNQAFIIYKISRPLNGVVTVYAEHISYLLSGFAVMPFTAVSCQDAISKIAPNMVPNNTPFTFNCNVSNNNSFELEAPRSVRNLLGGEQGSILDVYGSNDYKFDNFAVTLYADRGSDNGVTLRYGKNITGLKNTNDMTNVYTGIVPYWMDNNGNKKYVTGYVVNSSHSGDYPYQIIKVVDFSAEFETEPTEQQLLEKATGYIESNAGWKLKKNIDVSFVNLSQTEEYKDLALLERVKLCDTVTVIYDKLGVNVKTKVIKTVYNVLLEKYDSISLGDTTYTLAKAIQEAIDSPTITEQSTAIQNAVKRATQLIQGGLGGHVVFNTDGNGEPQEILIMDTADINTAVNVIRMNLNGIGFSHNGYNGPFETAWTIDGHFVADFIDAGELNGGLIKAGTISTSALSVDTMEDLNQMHDYLPYDLWTNIYRWGGSYSRLTLGTITVGGEEYQAMTMDCSEYTVGDTNNMTWIDSDFIGMPTMHVEFDCIFPSQLVLASDVSWFYITYSHSHSSYKKFHKIPAGTYEANTPYHFSFDISPSQDADGSDINARLGFTRGIATVVSIYNWTVKGTQANYNRASMTMNKYGLSSIVQSGNIISSINQSSESVDIQASKINLTGDLSLRGDFTSYNSVDAGTKAFLDDGTLAFYVGNGQGASDINFVVSANYFGSGTAGIAFGDPQDPLTAMHTLINQDVVKAVNLLAYYNGSQGTSAFGPDDTLLSEGTAQFHGGIIVNDDVLYNALGTHIVNVFFNPTQFNDTVMNSSGGTVFTSDRRKKRSIKDLAISKARSFIMGLKPIKYKFTKDISKSDRYHHGFIAQDVKEVMPEDWGLYCEDKDDDFIGLRYDEFIADMVAVIQDQEKRIESLERAIYDKSNNQS